MSLERAPKRQMVFCFIKREIEAGRTFPTSVQIRDYMGWQNASSALQCLVTMAAYDRVLERKVVDGQTVFCLRGEA